jgi:hypothetical protein
LAVLVSTYVPGHFMEKIILNFQKTELKSTDYHAMSIVDVVLLIQIHSDACVKLSTIAERVSLHLIEFNSLLTKKENHPTSLFRKTNLSWIISRMHQNVSGLKTNTHCSSVYGFSSTTEHWCYNLANKITTLDSHQACLGQIKQCGYITKHSHK